MTRALLCALLVSTAAAAADPEAELEPGAIPVEVKGATRPTFRVGAGKALGIKLKGPVSLRFAVTAEGKGATSAVAELDGKVVSSTPVKPGAKAEEIAVAVPTGKHAVTLRWPAGATGDALVAVSGVQLPAARPLMSLPGLDLAPGPSTAPALPPPGAQVKNDKAAAQAAPPPPLPGAPVKNDKAAALAAPPLPLPLPLPAQSDQKQASETLPLPGVAQPPAAAKPAEQKPPAPKPAATAATAPPPAKPPAAGGIRTTTAQNQPQPASALPAAPAPEVTGRGLVLRGPQLWSVTALVGGDRSSEDYTTSNSGTRVGLVATRALSTEWMLEGQFHWRNSTQEYAIQQPNQGGQTSSLDENRFDAGLSGGFDFGRWLLPDGRLLLMPMLGINYVGIRNRAFPSDLIGPQISGRVGYALSPAVIVQAEFGYTYNLSVSSSRSALGAPVGNFAMRAGFSLPLAGNYALSLNYQGDILAFNYVYRIAHGAAVGLGYSF